MPTRIGIEQGAFHNRPSLLNRPCFESLHEGFALFPQLGIVLAAAFLAVAFFRFLFFEIHVIFVVVDGFIRLQQLFCCGHPAVALRSPADAANPVSIPPAFETVGDEAGGRGRGGGRREPVLASPGGTPRRAERRRRARCAPTEPGSRALGLARCATATAIGRSGVGRRSAGRRSAACRASARFWHSSSGSARFRFR